MNLFPDILQPPKMAEMGLISRVSQVERLTNHAEVSFTCGSDHMYMKHQFTLELQDNRLDRC